MQRFTVGRITILGVFAAVLLSIIACGSTSKNVIESLPPAWFEDATASSGLQFQHNAGDGESYFMPRLMGSGVALIDYDQDGLLDVYLVQGAGAKSTHRNQLFQQRKDGTFKNVTKGSGVGVAGFGTGVAVGDVNNDGYPDLFVAEYGGHRLFLNNKGDGTFRDVTSSLPPSFFWATSASFLDYDRDGWLDLVVVNYLRYDPSSICQTQSGKRNFCGPADFPGTITRLYRNLGANAKNPGEVKFENTTKKAGLHTSAAPGLGVFCADFDGDGWVDVFVGNDTKANRLWMNQRDGTFKDEAIRRGLAFNGMGNAEGDMGVTIGDLNGDGLFELFSTHVVEETHTMWVQRPRGFFQDTTALMGLARQSGRTTGFGAVLADFDHDADLDLAFVSGKVNREEARNVAELGRFWGQFADWNRVFENTGNGRFQDRSRSEPMCASLNVGRGLAVGDLDNDGDLDLITTACAAPAKFYRNVCQEKGRWLVIRVLVGDPGRDAYGAEVTVAAGDEQWTRWVNPGYSYQSSNDPRTHFGLGERKSVDHIVVRWPDGAREWFPGGAVNRFLTLRQGTGRKLP